MSGVCTLPVQADNPSLDEADDSGVEKDLKAR